MSSTDQHTHVPFPTVDLRSDIAGVRDAATELLRYIADPVTQQHLEDLSAVDDVNKAMLRLLSKIEFLADDADHVEHELTTAQG